MNVRFGARAWAGVLLLTTACLVGGSTCAWASGARAAGSEAVLLDVLHSLTSAQSAALGRHGAVLVEREELTGAQRRLLAELQNRAEARPARAGEVKGREALLLRTATGPGGLPVLELWVFDSSSHGFLVCARPLAISCH